MKRWWRKNRVGYAFISPWLIGFFCFTFWPFLDSFYLSFTQYDIVTRPHWIGIKNYFILLGHDDLFWKSLWITLKYAAAAVPLQIVIGITLASLLNLSVRGIGFFRTAIYLPSVVPTVANAAIFIWILNPEIGLINRLLGLVGISGPAWLANPAWALDSLVLMSLWGIGNSMIIYLAGLKDVPLHLHEAAALDGANSAKRFLKFTLPMLSPVIFFNLVMGIISAFQYFTEAYVMTQGGPDGSTTFYSLYLWQRAWQYLDMGYACAMAWILFLVVIVITFFVFKGKDRWVHYES